MKHKYEVDEIEGRSYNDLVIEADRLTFDNGFAILSEEGCDRGAIGIFDLTKYTVNRVEPEIPFKPKTKKELKKIIDSLNKRLNKNHHELTDLNDNLKLMSMWQFKRWRKKQ